MYILIRSAGYVKGAQAGAQQELNVQQGVRNARESDYNYYVKNPIDLNNAQLENKFNHAAYDPRLKLLNYNVQNAGNDAFAKDISTASTVAPLGFLSAIG